MSERGRTIRHAELWGRRSAKYEQLCELDTQTTTWKELKPVAPHFFFVPKNFDVAAEYEKWWSLKDIFQVGQNGIKTDRDDLFFDFNRNVLEQRVQDFLGPKGLETSFRERYKVEDSSSYDLLTRRNKATFNVDNIRPCSYRPFDTRWLYYTPGLTSRPAWDVMRHLLREGNIAFCCLRQTRRAEVGTFFVSKGLTGKDVVSIFDIATVFPLYLYPETEQDRQLLAVMEPPTPYGRRSNLNPNFTRACSRRLGLKFAGDGRGDLAATWGPEDLFHYLYAVFHSQTYRSRYAELLKIDFPRLPLTGNLGLFRQLCTIGERLVSLHLMTAHVDLISGFPVPGDSVVEKVRFELTATPTQAIPHYQNAQESLFETYIPPEEDNKSESAGRVWINPTQYFDKVPEATWNFQVGGYQVCHKWLKDRTGRRLSFDDLLHYQRIVAALTETRSLMERIDQSIEQAGGWQLEVD